MVERTFVMIKPDGVAKGLVDEIIQRFQRADLQVVSQRRLKLDRQTAEKLYEAHHGKEFFERLVAQVLSGESVAMILEGGNAVKKVRQLIGPTDPTKAPKGTIRGDYGTVLPNNVVHAADSAESFKREFPIFF
jgi:nucleoside-diphosphate kinase